MTTAGLWCILLLDERNHLRKKGQMSKPYNTLTGPDTKTVDVDVTRAIQARICACHHLTPATEAKMDNCIFGPRPIPTREQTIERNSPGYVDPTPIAEEDDPDFPEWEDVKPGPEAFDYDKSLKSR